MQLGAVLDGEAHVGQHVVLALVHEAREPRPTRSELIRHLAPDLARARLVGLQEGLAEGGGDHALLALGDLGQRAAHPMHDPNAIDALRFSVSLPFAWPALARPRQRHPPAR